VAVKLVVPAKAGIHGVDIVVLPASWIPAFAGMTETWWAVMSIDQ